jgi:hypothetical protein
MLSVSIPDLIYKGVNALVVARKTLLRIVYSVTFVTLHKTTLNTMLFVFAMQNHMSAL